MCINNVNEKINTFIDHYSHDKSIVLKNLIKDINNNSLEINDLDNILSLLNEKQENRKKRGVYYTPVDVVDFIINETIENINDDEILNLTIFDPTCGNGEFLLNFIKKKLGLLTDFELLNQETMLKIINTIHGNDINEDSILICKLRIFLIAESYINPKDYHKLFSILDKNFTNFDYVNDYKFITNKYDLIIGNPPYVEDHKSDIVPKRKMGNLYTNILYNSLSHVAQKGKISYIIPISFVSTARMSKIRDILFDLDANIKLLNFADRPDSLFVQVHQKLTILMIDFDIDKKHITTSNYQYWYKDERHSLFDNIETVSHNFLFKEFLPKIGNKVDLKIFNSIINNKTSLFNLLTANGEKSLYLSMRLTFWSKVFLDYKRSNEYKEFKVNNEELYFLYCLLNSSLFFWFWTVVSDCWHITSKDLKYFRIPMEKIDLKKYKEYYEELSKSLEMNKEFVGTKQTEFEYKHKKSISEIHKIDEVICKDFGLSKNEIEYIKNFKLSYREGNKK